MVNADLVGWRATSKAKTKKNNLNFSSLTKERCRLVTDVTLSSTPLGSLLVGLIFRVNV